MKKCFTSKLLFLFFITITLTAINWLPAHTQCSSNIFGNDLGSITPTGSWQTTGCVTGGDYFTFTALAGNEYVFSFCQGGGSAAFDTQISINDEFGNFLGAITDFNDDFCGVQSELNWIAPADGTYQVFITDWPCIPGGTCGDLAYQTIIPPITDPINITTAPPYNDPSYLIEEIFLGGCLQVSNINYTGNPAAIGYFSNGGGIGMDEGIIISSGNATNGNPPNNQTGATTAFGTPGDADLTSTSGVNTNDAAVIEFDFVPLDETVEFNYIFASEEYPEFANSSFNDIFGFFIQGPGVATGNIAVVPGTTTAITINTINATVNNTYYVENPAGGTVTQFDGYTVVLTASASGLTPCETYNIKLAVADGTDSILDSAVFLEANSFNAGDAVFVDSFVPSTGTSDAYEGCEDGYFIFTRDDETPLDSPIDLELIVTGTATPGVDYDPLPVTVTIPSGQLSDTVEVIAFSDDILEGFESIIVQVNELQCDCTLPPPDTLNIYDSPEPFEAFVSDEPTICPGDNAILVIFAEGSQFTPYTYTWTDTNTGAIVGSGTTIITNPDITTTYNVEIEDACGRVITQDLTVTVSDAAPDATIAPAGPFCESDAPVTLTSATAGGTWSGPGVDPTTGLFDPAAAVATGPPPYTITYSINNSCGNDLDQITIDVTPEGSITINFPPNICPTGGNIILTSNVPGGTWSGIGIVGGTNTTGEFSPADAAATGPPPYEVSYAIPGSCGGTATEFITLGIVPEATADNDGPVCPGEDVTLTAGLSVPGFSFVFEWVGPDGVTVVATEPNPTLTAVTPAEAGTYTLNVTVDGCPAPPVTTEVVIEDAPIADASNDGPVCPGQDINLSTTVSGPGVTYNWTFGGVTISTEQNPVLTGVTAAEAGAYTLVVSVGACPSLPVETVVVIDAAVDATASNDGPICDGDDVTLSASTTTPGTATYTWTGPAFTTPNTEQNPTISGATAADIGVYTVVISVNGCDSEPQTTEVTLAPQPDATASNDSPACEGTTVTLSGSTTATGPGVTYTWTGPDFFTSNEQNPTIDNLTPAAAGTYTLVVSEGNCESDPVTTEVTLSPLPVATAINDGPVCPTQTVSLTGSTTATGTNIVYEWDGPAGPFTGAIYTLADFDPVWAGTYTLTVTVDGCVSAPVTTEVTLAPNPDATASSNSPICDGEDIQLNSSTSIAGTNITYSWTGPDSFTSNEQNPVITGATDAQTGTYTVVITVDGCESDPVETEVVVAPEVDATPSNNGPICDGEDIQLTAETTVTGTNITYSWTGPDSFTSDEQNPVITGATPANAGAYLLTVTVDGCESQTVPTVVIVFALPDAIASNDGPVCEGGTVNLLGSTTAVAPGATYTWTGPNSDVFFSDQQNPSISGITAAEAGVYTLVVTANGCESAPVETTIEIGDNPVATATNNGPSCAGGTVVLDGSVDLTGTNVVYTWTAPDGTNYDTEDVTLSDVQATDFGIYTLVVEVDGCISEPVETELIETPTPIASAVNDSPVCLGENVQLTGSADITGTTVEYVWTTPNGTQLFEQNPLLTAITAADAGTYELIVTIDGCASEPATTEVILLSTPDAIINFDSACEGDDLNLFGSTTATGTTIDYQWVTPSSGILSVQNPVIPNVGVDASGSYELIVTVDGCPSEPVAVDIEISIPPSVVISPATPLCNTTDGGSVIDLMDLITAGDDTGIWYDNNGVDIGSSPAPIDFDGSSPGTYEYTYELIGTPPCDNVLLTIPITVNDCNCPILSVQAPPALCNDAGVLELTDLYFPTTDIDGTWSFNIPPAGSPAPILTGTTFDATGAMAGDYELIYTYNGTPPPGCPATGDPITITVAETLSAGLDGGLEVCNSTDQILNLADYLGGVVDAGGVWSTSDFTDVGTFDPVAGTFSIFNHSAGVFTFTYSHDVDEPCVDTSADVSVVVGDQPDVLVVNPSETFCNTTEGGSLVILDDYLIFSEDFSGYWADENGDPLLLFNQFDFNGLAAGDYVFNYVTVSATTPCENQLFPITVTVENCECPVINLGTPDVLCNDGSTTFDLSSIEQDSEAGSWTITTDLGGIQPSISGDLFDATGATAGDYELIYTLDTPPFDSCADSDVVTITVNEPLSAGTGSSTDVCEDSNDAVDLISLLVDAAAGGTWSIGTGTIDGGTFDAVAGTFTPNGNTPGTITFTYTVSGNVPCPDDSEAVTVVVNEAPNAGTGGTFDYCNDETALIFLDDLLIGEDTGGSWAVVSAVDVGAFDNVANSFDPSGHSPGLLQFIYTVTGTGGCGNDTESLFLNIGFNPSATVEGINTCNTTAAGSVVDFSALITSGDDSGNWSDNGVGASTFPLYDFDGVPPGTYIFTYTLTSATGICTNPSYDVTILVEDCSCPSVATLAPPVICNDNGVLNLADYQQTTELGAWTISNDNGAVPPPTITGTNFDATGVAAGDYELTFTLDPSVVIPDPACPIFSTQIVTVNAAVSAGTGNTFDYCNNETAIINLNDLLLDEDTGGNWTVSAGSVDAGAFTASTGEFNPDGHTAGSITFTYTITGVAPCTNDTEDVIINIAENLTAELSGTTICNSDQSGSSTVLNFNDLFTSGDNTSGIWAETTASGVDLTDASSIDFAGITPGTYTFTYILSNDTPCVDDVNTIDVLVQDCACPSPATSAFAELCNDSGILNVNDYVVTTEVGSWALTNDNGAANPPAFDGTIVDATNADEGTYEFTFTLDAAPVDGCPDSTVQLLTIYNYNFAGTDVVLDICNNSTDLIDIVAQIADADTGGTLSIDAASDIPTDYDDVAGIFNPIGENEGVYVFNYTFDANGVCTGDVAQVTINIFEQPNADILASANICNTDAEGSILNFSDFITGGDTSGSWTDDDGAGVDLITNLNAVDFDGVTPGTYNFTYTLTAGGECTDDVNTIAILVEDCTCPSVATAAFPEICNNDINIALSDYTITTEVGSWTLTNDNGAVNPPVIVGDTINVIGADEGTYELTFTLATTPNAGCPENSVQTLTIYNFSQAGTGDVTDICNDSEEAITLSDLLIDADAGGTWSVTVGAPTPTNFDAATGTFIPTAEAEDTYLFTYSVAANGECPASEATVTVNVFNQPNADVLASTNTCNSAAEGSVLNFNDFVTAGGTGGTWTDDDGAGVDLTGDLAAIDFDGVTPGTYNFTYTLTANGACVDDVNTIAVLVEDCTCPSAATTVLPDICNDNGVLNLADFVTTAEAGSWAITDSGTAVNIPSLTGNDFDATGADEGSYTLTFTLDAAPIDGCPDSTVQTINVFNAPDAGTGGSDVFCNNDDEPTVIDLSTYLSGSDTGGTWSTADPVDVGAFDAATATFDPFNHTEGTFTFTYTLGATAPCVEASTNVSITVQFCDCTDPAPPTPIVSELSICDGDPVAAFEVTAAPNTTINWYSEPAGGEPIEENTTSFTADMAGTYYAEAVNVPDDGCASERVPFTLEVLPNPLAIIDAPTTICLGDEAIVSFNGVASETATYTWEFGDGTTITGIGPHNVAYSTAGIQTVSLLVSDSGCEDNATFDILVSTVSVDAQASSNLVALGESVDLTAVVSGGENIIYSWTSSLDPVSCDTCAVTSASPIDATTYTVFVVDENGCNASDDVAVNVRVDNLVVIPNAFSPNGDGINDVFRINGVNIVDFDLMLFNRWGEQVYNATNTTDTSIGWDGTYKGEDAEIEVYVYVAKVRFIDGSEELFKGNVTLIR